jgi:hypothetical protein
VTIVWPTGLIFNVFHIPDFLTALAIEGLPLSLAFLFLKNYRIVTQGDEERIYSQKMVSTIGLPFAIFGGMLVALIGFVGWDPNRVIDAGRSTIQLDAFLAVGWTIGFSILERWSKEFREMRLQLVAFDKKGVREASELLLSTTNQPIEAVGTLMVSIAFFVLSGTLATLVVLSANTWLLGLSVGVLLAGVGIMLLTWYDLYRRAELLRYAIDTMPEALRTPQT